MSCWWGCEVTKRAHQEIMRRNQPEHQTFAKALHTQAVSSLAVGGGGWGGGVLPHRNCLRAARQVDPNTAATLGGTQEEPGVMILLGQISAGLQSAVRVGMWVIQS